MTPPAAPSYRYIPHDDDAPLVPRGAGGAPAARTLAPTDDVESFVASPIGRCVVGASFLVWCHSPELQGAIIWGTVDEAALRAMLSVGRFAYHRDISKRRRLLVDCRNVLRAHVDVMLGFAEMARARVRLWDDGIERHAIVVPAGLEGILLAGALPSLGVEHPIRFARDLESALAFVDHPAARGAHQLVTALAAEAQGRSVLIARLRGELGRALVNATIERSAAALGTSTRTLQRELARLGTSFTDELRRARLAAAETLLVHSDLKIDAIAAQVGYGTASRMSATLRRERNVTASELRARARGAQR